LRKQRTDFGNFSRIHQVLLLWIKKERELKINKYQVAPEQNDGILFRNKKTQERFHNPQHNSSTDRNVSRREFFASFTIHNNTHFYVLIEVGHERSELILSVWLLGNLR